MTDAAEIVSAFLDAYNRHDAMAATALYEEACSHADVALGGRREGRAALGEGFTGFLRMMPDAAWRERERILSGREVVVVYTLTGTVVPRPKPGEAPGAPRSIELAGTFLFEIGEAGLTRDTRLLGQGRIPPADGLIAHDLLRIRRP